MKIFRQFVLFNALMFTASVSLAHPGHHDFVSYLHQLQHLAGDVSLWLPLAFFTAGAIVWTAAKNRSDKHK